MEIITGLFGGIWGWVAAAVGVLAVLGGAYLKGHSAGKQKAKTDQLEQTLRNMETRDEIDREIAGIPDSAVRDRLRDDARK